MGIDLINPDAYTLDEYDKPAMDPADMTEGVDYKDEAEYEYKMAREYNWNVKSKASKGYEENFFFLFRGDGVYYNELETRVRLRKRRNKKLKVLGMVKDQDQAPDPNRVPNQNHALDPGLDPDQNQCLGQFRDPCPDLCQGQLAGASLGQ